MTGISLLATLRLNFQSTLGHDRPFVRAWYHKSPARPGGCGVAVRVDGEIGQHVVIVRLIGPRDVFFYEGLDGGRAFHRAETTDPFSVFGEQQGIGRKMSSRYRP